MGREEDHHQESLHAQVPAAVLVQPHPRNRVREVLPLWFRILGSRSTIREGY